MTDTDETVTSSQAHSLRVWAGRIVAAVVVVYGVSVANDLLLADTRLIADRADMVSLDRVPAWSVEVQHALFGQGSVGYRLTAMLVHLLNCGLLLLVARRWTSASLAGWGTLIFAIWPSGSQAVLHLGSQAELLTTTWILSALWLSGGGRFHVIRAVGLLLIVILGLHTSAQAFALPLFLLLVHHRLARRGQPTPTWLMHLSAYGTAAGWLLWKMFTRAADTAIIDPLTNPLASLSTSQRVMVALDQGWSYAQSLLVPLRLSADDGCARGIAACAAGLRPAAFCAPCRSAVVGCALVGRSPVAGEQRGLQNRFGPLGCVSLSGHGRRQSEPGGIADHSLYLVAHTLDRGDTACDDGCANDRVVPGLAG